MLPRPCSLLNIRGFLKGHCVQQVHLSRSKEQQSGCICLAHLRGISSSHPPSYFSTHHWHAGQKLVKAVKVYDDSTMEAGLVRGAAVVSLLQCLVWPEPLSHALCLALQPVLATHACQCPQALCMACQSQSRPGHA